MNQPLLPGMVDAYVRQRQREMEQQAEVNEQVRLALAAGAPRRPRVLAVVARALLTVPAKVLSLVNRPRAGAVPRQELELRR
jgi:hypothetical protein